MRIMKNVIIYLVILITGELLFSQDGNTPTNLQVDAASVGGVTLSWDTPENFRREWITHTNSDFLGGIGAGGVGHFVCQKFPDTLLSDYHGMLVKELAFVPSSDANYASFQPFVFETDAQAIEYEIPDMAGRSNLVLSAPAMSFPGNDLTIDAWNSVDLKNHVPGASLLDDIEPSTYLIDSTKSIWFGYWIYDYDFYPSGADMGPAEEGLGNVIIWCPETGCFESTLNLSSDPPLDFDWMLALSIINPDSSDTTSRFMTLSNDTYLPMQEDESLYLSQNINQTAFKMELGRIREITIEPLENVGRDISNYFVFENGLAVDVVQPSYTDFNTTIREQTILGEREPGFYEYFVRAQTANGLSDSSNIVSVNIQNNPPAVFSLIAPEDGAMVSVTQTNIDNPISFIWTNSVDTDGQSLYFTLDICKQSGDMACYDTTMTDRIYQPSAQDIMDSLDLSSGTNLLSWSVFVTDGLDTVSSSDSTRYLTLVIDQLGNDLSVLQPNRFSLNQNYPNPFNPVTTITFELAKSEFVRLNVYDVNGNLVKNLINNENALGQHNVNWDGTNNENKSVAGGLYLYRIDTESFSSTKKMLLLK